MGALLAIVVAIILYVTLYPFHFDFSRTTANPFVFLLHAWPAKFDRFVMRDVVLNVAFFVPLGVSAFLTVARRHRRALGILFAVMLGSALSASVEMLQIYDAHRYCSAVDWLCNTAGAFIGAVFALALRPRIASILSSAGGRGASAGLLLAGCWVAAQIYPPIPVFSRGHLRPSWAHFMASHVSAVEVFAGAAGWFVFALALRAAWGRIASRTIALALLLIPLRLFLSDRVVSKSDVVAGVLGLLLWSITPDQTRQGAGWLLLLAAIVLRELAPFDFSGPAHAFSWVPFGATMAAEPTPAVAVLLRKAFEYGAMIWLLHAGKVGYLTGGAVLAIALAAMEALQCLMPGRSAEITDAVLALIMAVVLYVTQASRPAFTGSTKVR